MRTEKSAFEWYQTLRNDSRWKWYDLDDVYQTYQSLHVELHFDERGHPQSSEAEKYVADRFFESVRADQARA